MQFFMYITRTKKKYGKLKGKRTLQGAEKGNGKWEKKPKTMTASFALALTHKPKRKMSPLGIQNFPEVRVWVATL